MNLGDIKSLKTIQNVVWVVTVVVVSVWADVKGYQDGYQHAQEDKDKSWHQRLLDADYAEFDRKTGQWKMRPMEDVLMTGTILGKAPILGILPEDNTTVVGDRKYVRNKSRH
jgi:hypothetical protein